MTRLSGVLAAFCLAIPLGVSCSLPQEPASETGATARTPGPRESPLAAPQKPAKPGACFGDLPPDTLAPGEAHPIDLLTDGRHLFWLSGGVIRRLDLATRQVTSFGPNGVANLRAVDSRDLVVLTSTWELGAIDLSTGQLRVLARPPSAAGARPGLAGLADIHARMQATQAFIFAEYALDPDYVYFASHPMSATYNYASQHARSIAGPHDLGSLSRVRRDGSAAIEELGAGPDLHFVVSNGYAYWGSRFEGIKRRSLVPGAANEVVWAAPDLPYAWPIAVSGGRVLFSTRNPEPHNDFTIASVPAGGVAADAGSGEPRIHVASSARGFARAILDGSCLYSDEAMGVSRADLGDGSVRELIAGPPIHTVQFGPGLATDGQSLYWADSSRDRILRWRR